MDDKDKKHTGKEARDRGDEFRAIPSDILKHGTKGPIFGCLGYIIGDEKLPSYMRSIINHEMRIPF